MRSTYASLATSARRGSRMGGSYRRPVRRHRHFGSGLNRPERGVDHVGPNGSPSEYHARKTRIQATMVHHVYGSISATMVPTPALFSYSCANPTTNARCGFSGLMTLVGESLTR